MQVIKENAITKKITEKYGVTNKIIKKIRSDCFTRKIFWREEKNQWAIFIRAHL